MELALKVAFAMFGPSDTMKARELNRSKITASYASLYSLVECRVSGD